MAVLEVAHELGRDRMLTAQWAAQLADDALNAGVQVDVLAHERRASAVRAAIAIGLQRADAAAQLHALELLDVVLGGTAHAGRVRRRAPRSCLRDQRIRRFTRIGAWVEKRWAFVGRRGFAIESEVLDFFCQNS